MSDSTVTDPKGSRYGSRRWLQTSFVIVCAFISLWTETLDSTALVTLVLGALGVFAGSRYGDKKAEVKP